MVGDLRTVPLSALSYESRNLLSSRLNAKKIVPVVGPDQISRHRDWRGLASLINISSEVAASIRCNDREDKTDKVLTIWSGRNDGSATVGRLMDFLQILDRHDVCDDILEFARDNKLIVLVQTNRIAYNPVIILDGSDDDFITYDDKLYGTPQRYHAYVLYSRADRDFVDELLRRTRQEGFKMCTEDDLIAGHATPFEPVSRLIAERCRYIVLVYSPDFLMSPAIAFYMNLAQADAISKKQLKIIPVMYRECSLPRHLAYYHNLRYSPPAARAPYNFWDRLAHSLRIVDAPRITLPTTVSHSDVQITETSQSISNGYQVNGIVKTLALPDVPKETTSLTNLHRLSDEIPTSYDTKSLNSSRQSSKGKKSGPFRKIMNTFRGKKQKKAISVENL